MDAILVSSIRLPACDGEGAPLMQLDGLRRIIFSLLLEVLSLLFSEVGAAASRCRTLAPTDSTSWASECERWRWGGWS